jgi:acetyl esterase/lipase
MMMAALMVIRDMNLPKPAGGIGLSPWVDLTHSCPSYFENNNDYLPKFRDNRFPSRLHYYTANEYLTLPYVSPYFATNLNNLPPLLFQCGSAERLYDEITELASKLKNINLQVYEGHVHVFQAIRFCNASIKAIERLCDFCRERCVERKPVLKSRIDYDFQGDFVSVTPL